MRLPSTCVNEELLAAWVVKLQELQPTLTFVEGLVILEVLLVGSGATTEVGENGQ